MCLGGEEAPILKEILSLNHLNPWQDDASYDDSKLQLPTSLYGAFFKLARELVGSFNLPGAPLHYAHYLKRFSWQWGHEIEFEDAYLDSQNSTELLRTLVSKLSDPCSEVLACYEGSSGNFSIDQMLGDNSLIEDAPFVWPNQFRSLPDKEVSERILLLKTPTHTYRLDHLLDLFKDSQVDFIYLTRNPYATVNGLIDGWSYPGFHSLNIKRLLGDSSPSVGDFWKFDLYPGWQSDLKTPLAQIAFNQCFYNHRELQKIFERRKLRPYQISYENICDANQRMTIFKNFFSSLGLDNYEPDPSLLEGAVMNSGPVRPDRWLNRKVELENLFKANSEFKDIWECLL